MTEEKKTIWLKREKRKAGQSYNVIKLQICNVTPEFGVIRQVLLRKCSSHI